MQRIPFTLALLISLFLPEITAQNLISYTHTSCASSSLIPHHDGCKWWFKVPGRKHHHKKRDRLLLQLGGGANYSWGRLNTVPSGLQSSLLNPQFQTFIGIKFDHHKCKSNAVGLWGTFGLHSEDATRTILDAQELTYNVETGSENQGFNEWEVGFLMQEKLRISAGTGNFSFIDANGSEQNIEYYSATTGFMKEVGQNLRLTGTASVLFGKDFQNISLRPSLGLVYNISFLRM